MRRLALLLLFTLIVACSRSCSRVAIGTGSDAAPHTPRMGGLVSPPPFPSLPGGAVLDLRIDLGRTNTSGILTQWVDQSPNAYVFTPPGVQTGPVIAATQFQQYDGQSWQNLTTIELSSTAAHPWTSGQARTIAAVTGAVNAANSPVMRMGGSGSTPIIYEGGTVSIGGTANNTGPLLYEGSPHIKTWAFTPATNQAVYLNGYQVTALTAGTAIGGTVTSDSGNANLQLGHDDAAGTLKFPGDIEQVEGYAGILSAPTLTSLHGYLAGKFEITGVQGYVSDSATIPFYAFYQYMNMIASEGALRFYTTQTSGNISFTAQQSTAQAPTTTNLPMYEVFIDGVYNQTQVIATSSAPFAPSSYTLTTAALDGNPHVVEIWTPPLNQVNATFPTGGAVSSMQDSGGLTILYPTITPPNRAVVWGDSISLGYGTTGGFYQGGFQLLRQNPNAFNGRWEFWATSGRSVYTESTFDATYASTAAAICTMLDDVAPSGGQLLVSEIGTNDWGGTGGNIWPGGLAAWGPAWLSVITQVHALCPGARVLALGPIVRASQSSNNSNGFSLVGLRSEEQTECATISSYCTYLDSSQNFTGCGENVPAVTSGELNADGTHPTNAGHAVYNTWLQAAVACEYPQFATLNAVFFGTEAENDNAEPVCVERRYGKCG